MKKKTVFELHIDEYLPLRFYHFEGDKGEGEAVGIGYDNLDEMAKEMKCSRELLRTLLVFRGDMSEMLKELRKDMIDLYEKMEE